MASEMQIRGVAVEPVDLDDFVLPTSSRPRRSVPRKNYLAMLDTHKTTSPTKKLSSSPQKTSVNPQKKTPDKKTSTGQLELQEDEQLKTWKILVKHDLITQVNKQICGGQNKNTQANNDENSRQNCINEISKISQIHEQQNQVLNFKTEQVKNIFNHFKWFRNSRDEICSPKCEMTTESIKMEPRDVVEETEDVLPATTSSVTCKVEPHLKQEYSDITIKSEFREEEVIKENEDQTPGSANTPPRKNSTETKILKQPKNKLEHTKQEMQLKEIKMNKRNRQRKSNDNRERKYQCTYCCKMFLTKSNLNSHIMVHTGIKPFECNICKKKFSQIGNLQNHLARIHLGEKKYTCKYCERKFTELGNVQRHEKSVHDVSRKFECDFCKYRFKIKTSLKKHLEIYHIGRILKCYECKKKCKVLPSLYDFIVKNKKWKTFKCSNCNRVLKVGS